MLCARRGSLHHRLPRLAANVYPFPAFKDMLIDFDVLECPAWLCQSIEFRVSEPDHCMSNADDLPKLSA